MKSKSLGTSEDSDVLEVDNGNLSGSGKEDNLLLSSESLLP